MPDIETCNAAELEALWNERGSGFTEPQLKQTKVRLEQLKIAPKVFQPRDNDEARWEKEKHIKHLADVLKAGTPLDRITVFPIAGMFIVVDGHCRLKAYQQAKWKKKVPVQILRGTFVDAFRHAPEANSKDKLRLTHSEKLEAAWRMVLFSENREEPMTQREIATATGAGKGTVYNMQAKLRESPIGSQGDPREMTWKEVVRAARRVTQGDDEWRERVVREYAEKFRSAFGNKLDATADLILDAFEVASKRLHDEVIERAAVKYAEEVRSRGEYIAAELRQMDF